MEKKLLLGNNLEKLRELEDNSIDSIVSDPPYGLSFMNKKWDYDVPSVEFWKEVLRVLKPGGHLLSFGGTRTYHRMTVNIEDAGFEIRDCIQWLYGSGFPKSHNIGKAIDKLEGNEREEYIDEDFLKRNPSNNKDGILELGLKDGKDAAIRTKGNSQYEGWGTALKPANEPIVMARKPLEESTIAENVLKYGTGGINIDGSRIGNEVIKINKINSNENLHHNYTEDGNGKWEGITEESSGRFPANIILDEIAAEELDKQSGIGKSSKFPKNYDGGFGSGENVYGSGNVDYERGYTDTGGASRFFYNVEVTEEEKNIDKLISNEPIVMARKPLEESTIAENVLKYGTGGINIDGSRIGTEQRENPIYGDGGDLLSISKGGEQKWDGSKNIVEGRFPANIILDEIAAEELDKQSGIGKSQKRSSKYNKDTEHTNTYTPVKSDYRDNNTYGDTGGASRFFYTAKVSKKERNLGLNGFEEKQTKQFNSGMEGKVRSDGTIIKEAIHQKNSHPTVKPIQLMSYLCKLITPPNGTILDPYMGSGSTGIAALLNGFNFVGMEMEEEYFNIASSRIDNYEEYRQFLK